MERRFSDMLNRNTQRRYLPKSLTDELVEHKFLSRHDAEGKFLYLDTKYIFNIIFKHTIINTFLNSKAI